MTVNVPISHPNYGDMTHCPVCNKGVLAQKLQQISGLSDEMLGWTLYDFFKLHGKMDAHAAADRFAGDPKGWLTLWGGYGVGKTYLLAATVNACRLRGIAASYRVLPELLNQLRATYEDDAEVAFDTMIDDLKSVTVLALDEMDQPGRTPWALKTVFEILDSRYRNMREVGTVLAQNSNPALDPDGPLGYLYSRIHDGRFEVVEISGGDVRPLMGKEEE